ncbi:MAG: peptidylprolyl isomerase [Terrisporobacter sp.]|uniref:peptidylprolyl isomerase n=1 Tax=Terrisporobacter sp. TaxID=1965305 RepID=UPI002F94E2CE
MKRLVLIGLAALISVNMVGCGNDTIAKINDVKISKDEYNKIASFLYATGYVQEDKNKGINNNILSFIIDNEVAYQDAQRENIKVEDKDVNEKYEDLKETLKSNSAYKAKLDEVGVNDDFLKSQVKKDLIVSKYKENFMKNIKINDNEIKTYYDNHKDEFTKEEVRASQILISTLDDNNNVVNQEQKEKLKDKAEDILEKLKNNEDFAILAKEYSDDKNSGKDGGDLGYFSKEDKNIDFTNPVFKLEKDQLSDIIETEYGYHIVKLTDNKSVTKTLEESKEDIKNKILNQKYTQHIDSLYKNGKITIT